MHRRLFILSAVSLFLAGLFSLARAQVPLTGAGKGRPAVAGYSGLGEIATAAAYWGLRGYSAAYAAPGNNPAIDIVKASDGPALMTINILSNGDLDVAP